MEDEPTDEEKLSLQITVQNTRRRDVLLAFPDSSDEPITPSELASRTGMEPPNVSRNLRKLRDENLVKSIETERSRLRPYVITELGVEIRQAIQEQDDRQP